MIEKEISYKSQLSLEQLAYNIIYHLNNAIEESRPDSTNEIKAVAAVVITKVLTQCEVEN